jgi:RNA-directed DNA polymerase
MTSQPKNRQDLYDRIRSSSKEEVILEEMIRLGFWPAAGEMPKDPADEIRRKGEILRELAALRTQNSQLQNEEALKKAALALRLAESKRKQQETKARRERERQERLAIWELKKQQEIVFLGEGVSGGLNQTECDRDRLQTYGLPEYGTSEEIATAMGISLGELRFLAFARRASSVSHYIRFKIAKKTGGERLISAPMPRLKQAQTWILHNILEVVDLHDSAHGFCRGRSIVSNAAPHVGADIVINLDLQNFFPSISYKRVKGLFRALGYSEIAATIFGLICTSSDVEAVELDGKTYYVALGGGTHPERNRHLPQGAPSSPAITNLICRRLDLRLTKMATHLGFVYTRYADDLTFSSSGENLRQICNMLKRTEAIATYEGFIIHPQKTRVLHKSQRQEVTGIVVNQKLNVEKDTLKRFRATLFQIEKDGLAGKHWGNCSDLLQSIEGFANFVAMVNPEKGAKLKEQVQRIKAIHRPRLIKRVRQKSN